MTIPSVLDDSDTVTFVGIAVDIPLPGLFDYVWPMEEVPMPGDSVLVPWGQKIVWGWVWEVRKTLPQGVQREKIKAVAARVVEVPRLSERWMSLIGFASRYYHHPIGACIADTLPKSLKTVGKNSSVLPPLKKWAKQNASESGDVAPSVVVDLQSRALTPEQAAALSDIGATSAFGVFLLHGITGSGKTEVYLQAILSKVQQGRQCLLLLPEINLTPAVEQFFAKRLQGLRVGTLHSGLTDTQRLKNWLAASTHRLDLIISTRLGVFTPLPALGLVIVDEEHDPSYKQMEGLKYSARDIAIMAGRLNDCPVVLGSATPSLETWHKTQSGQYRHLTLKQRAVAGAVLPQVELVDTRHHPSQAGLSKPVVEALKRALEAGEQSIVFLNRRGYAPTLMCESCGWVADCHQCSAHVVWHRKDGLLRCHHCGASKRVPPACPTCGNQDLTPFGRGTQRLEEALQAVLPSARILRIDADSTRGKGAAQAAFETAHHGEVDVLVGTQMVAKGHDFQRVRLVVAVNVDAALFSHQPKSAERLFSQLMQVAGRAGRAGGVGRFMVQTNYPHHPLFVSLLKQDYEGFAAFELDARRAAGFAPFVFQVLVRADHKRLDHAMGFLSVAKDLAQNLLAEMGWDESDTIRLCDPVPLTVVRVAGVERGQLLVESASRSALHAFLNRWLPVLWQEKGSVRWFIDVDPVEI